MSERADVSLPGNVRILDVVVVLAGLLGVERERRRYGDDEAGMWFAATVEGGFRYVQHDGMPEMISLDFGRKGYLNFHYEPGGEDTGRRLVSTGAAPFTVAVMMKLANFFGGRVSFSDWLKRAKSDPDYATPDKTDGENCPDDGEAYFRFQDRLMNVEKITRTDVRVAVALIEARRKIRRVG